MPRPLSAERRERVIDFLYGLRDEIIAIIRKQVSLQRQQLHLMKRQEQLEIDRAEEKINEGRYIEDARLMHANWTTYKNEIIDLSHEVLRLENNMHDTLDLCATEDIDCYTPYYADQTTTLIRLGNTIQANIKKGCT